VICNRDTSNVKAEAVATLAYDNLKYGFQLRALALLVSEQACCNCSSS